MPPRRIAAPLVAVALLTLACGAGPTPEAAAPAAPSAAVVPTAADRATARLAALVPSAAVPDPKNDEVLAYIAAAVDPDDATWARLVTLYERFRADQAAIQQRYQAQLPPSLGGQGAGGPAAGAGGPAAGAGPGRPGGPRAGGPPPGGRPGGGPPPGAGRQGGPGGPNRLQQVINDARAEHQALQASFLAEGRALLDTDAEIKAWDLCASTVDLAPPTTGTPMDEVRFDPNAGPQVGEAAPDFTLTAIDGRSVSLSSFRGTPVVLEFGSYTCPAFRETATKLQPLVAQYAGKVAFVVVYGLEAHPTDGWVSPVNTQAGIAIPQHQTLEDRKACAVDAQAKLGLTGATILVDGLDNAVVKAWGGHPNRSYIIGRDGKVVARSLFSDPEETRRVLGSL